MAGRRPLPDIMGEALGRLPLPPAGDGDCKVLPLSRPAGPDLDDVARGLKGLGLGGMARALGEMAGGDQAQAVAFAHRLDRLIRIEAADQERRRVAGRIRRAGLRQAVAPEDLRLEGRPGPDAMVLAELVEARWVAQGHDLLIDGPVGSGKTWLASALVTAACRAGSTALYRPLPLLLAELATAREKGSLERKLAALARPRLLALDDWGLEPLERQQRLDLWALVDRRHGRCSTLVASHLPPDHWRLFLGEGRAARALTDRLTAGARRLSLSGPSRR